MIITTTPFIDGHPVAQYLGLITGETILGVNMFKDIGAGPRNLVGGRSKGYENELANARNTAIAAMEQRAVELGAHGIIGVDFAYETLGGTGMLMVAVSGTAVRFAN